MQRGFSQHNAHHQAPHRPIGPVGTALSPRSIRTSDVFATLGTSEPAFSVTLLIFVELRGRSGMAAAQCPGRSVAGHPRLPTGNQASLAAVAFICRPTRIGQNCPISRRCEKRAANAESRREWRAPGKKALPNVTSGALGCGSGRPMFGHMWGRARQARSRQGFGVVGLTKLTGTGRPVRAPRLRDDRCRAGQAAKPPAQRAPGPALTRPGQTTAASGLPCQE